MDSPLTIRAYCPQDWDALVDIHDSARRIELANAGLDAAFVPLAQAAVSEGLFDYTLRVAVLEGRVVGFVAYTEDELAWLYTHPQHMRRGIGRALIRHVLAENPGQALSVEVPAGNAPALALYEAMGFRTVAVATGAMPGNETFQVTVHCMEIGPRAQATPSHQGHGPR